MKTIVGFIIFFLLLILCGLWSPWLYINIDWQSIVGLQSEDQIAGLEVYSLAGELEIFVGEDLIGTVTAANSPFIFDRVSPGRNLVRIKRINPSLNFEYWTFSKVIEFETGKTVVISLNLGPSEASSEGQVIFAVPKRDTTKPNRVNIKSNVFDFVVQVDGVATFNSTENQFFTSFDVNSQKRFRISKLGYESIEFVLLPDSQEDRDKLRDFDLEVEVILMEQFLEIVEL